MKKQGILESEFVNDCHIGFPVRVEALQGGNIAVSEVALQ